MVLFVRIVTIQNWLSQVQNCKKLEIMKNLLSLLLMSLFVLASATNGNSQDKTRPQPNVIILLADDLGWQDVKCYDFDEPSPYETPNIDALAKDGAMFWQGYSHAADYAPKLTLASHEDTIEVLPILIINTPTPSCSSVDLTAPSITAGSDPGLFEYFLDEQLTSPIANPIIVNSGTYYIRLTYQGSSITKPINVIISAPPTLNITPPVPCIDIDLTDAAITAGSDPGFLEYFQDPFLSIPLLNPNSVSRGTYYIRLTNLAGCSTTEAISVSMSAPPTLSFPVSPFCAPFNLTVIDLGSDYGTVDYFVDEDLTTPLDNPTAVTSGTYHIRFTTTAGCPSSQSSVIISISAPPTLNITSPALSCTAINLTDAAITAGSDSGDIRYFSDVDLTTQIANPTSVGSGIYYIQLTNVQGCSIAKPVTVTVKDSCNTNNPSEFDVFNEFPWLNNIVTPASCNNETITVYETGPYRYVYVTTENSSRLFNSEGDLYCTSAPNYDCVAAYNLVSVVGNWSCLTTNPTGENGNTDDDSEMQIFDDYPWLSHITTPENCSNATITVYETGPYHYIYVTTDESNRLFSSEGVLYCTSAPNYDCVALYNLNTIIASWSCSNITNEPNTDQSSLLYTPKKQLTASTDIQVFPNPAKEKVFVTIPSFKISDATQRLHLIDISGRRLLSINVNDSRMELDVSRLLSGLYMLQWHTSTTIKTTSLIIE